MATPKPPLPEDMWFIAGSFTTGQAFLYTGGTRTRRQAIDDHTKALGIDWKACRRNGDRAMKCRVIPNGATP